jgi:hypothetical protein
VSWRQNVNPLINTYPDPEEPVSNRFEPVYLECDGVVVVGVATVQEIGDAMLKGLENHVGIGLSLSGKHLMGKFFCFWLSGSQAEAQNKESLVRLYSIS